MQGKRRWKEREDAMYQPACARISDDYLHSWARKTQRIRSGTRTGKGPCTGLSELAGLARRAPGHFIPPGQRMPPATFCRGVPSRAAFPSRPTARQRRRQIPCAQREALRAPEMDSASLCQALTTLPACISLSPVFQREMVSFPSPFFAPGHKQSRTKDERKMQWGGVRRGRDI